MKDSSQEKESIASKSDGPPAWIVASQFGMVLVAYTCVLGFGGYLLGDRVFHSQMAALGLSMSGLFVGFALAIVHLFQLSKKIDKSMPNRGKPLPDDPDDAGSGKLF